MTSQSKIGNLLPEKDMKNVKGRWQECLNSIVVTYASHKVTETFLLAFITVVANTAHSESLCGFSRLLPGYSGSSLGALAF